MNLKEVYEIFYPRRAQNTPSVWKETPQYRSKKEIFEKTCCSGNQKKKSIKQDTCWDEWQEIYELSITNFEVMVMFRNMVHGWFASTASNYNGFLKALLQDDIKAMNAYMNRTALATFSFFDSGRKPSEESEPERFYHGFVLGLLVDLGNRYYVTSNRESGFGRYDVLLEPKNQMDDAVILEFKVHDSDEKSLEDTVQAALNQIEEKKYEVSLVEKGIPENRIGIVKFFV